jgi:hypothetical protein
VTPIFRVMLAAAVLAAPAQAAPPTVKSPSDVVGRGCPPERAQDGEVRIVFLGDSGYGTGVSEWGAHGQEAVANQVNNLALKPDLVFFLGDNIYWLGSADLYKTRFDDMYDPLIRECRAHVALGNHDVKGCRAVQEYEQWESCFTELRTSLAADLKARYQRQGMSEEEAAARAETEAIAETSGELAVEAVRARKANCIPGDASAYEMITAGSCNAEAALSHAQFGFGSVEKGDPPASQRQRYYSIPWPLPQTTPSGQPDDAAPVKETTPLVHVIVLDSNTLHVDNSVLGQTSPLREDRLQMLWLRSQMRRWPIVEGKGAGAWKILGMHHPPRTPRSCACKVLGKCVGGHSDELELDAQLNAAFEGLEPPDIVMSAHNHIYARSHPLDGDGKMVKEGKGGGVRYFVTGGGGAPLYGIRGGDDRWASALTMYHFVYMRLTATSAFYWTIDDTGRVRDAGCFEKGSNVDYPLAPDFTFTDALPPRCTVDGSQPAVSKPVDPAAAAAKAEKAEKDQAAGKPER